MTQRQEEILLVVAILAGIAAMIASILFYQRRKEARLAASARLVLPIESVLRTVAVLLPSGAALPVLVGVIGATTDPWLRGHALGAVLVSVFGGVALVVVALRLTRDFRSVGTLAWTPSALTLSYRDAGEIVVDLSQPYALAEARTHSPHGPCQVVVVTGSRDIAFTYVVRGKRVGGVAPFVDRPEGPLFGPEARVLHERMRADLASRTGP
jgi:hypothetical protein